MSSESIIAKKRSLKVRGGGEWVTSAQFAFQPLYRAQAECGADSKHGGQKWRSSCLSGLVLSEIGGKRIRQRTGWKAVGSLWKEEKVISCSFDNGED